MIAHQAIRMTEPVKTLQHLRQNPQKRLAIWLVEVDGLLGVASARHVIDGAGILNAKGTGHAFMLTKQMLDCKT